MFCWGPFPSVALSATQHNKVSAKRLLPRTMAKDWKPVKADICRYYANGIPLKEVKLILSREKGFHASLGSPSPG